jgi:2-polyprenyl-6-methoxyphenol hydroxylase-like FAD-dependent oxidoreductase
LEELLPADLVKDLSAVSVNYHTNQLDAMAVINGMTGEKMTSVGGFPRGHPKYMLRAHRQRFRQYLLQDLAIQFGKAYDHYEESENGVTAFFKDGTSATGTLLVGADGAHSAGMARNIEFTRD